MKKVFLILAAVAAVSTVGAQDAWTLRQCIDYAVENNIALQQQALSVESAEIDLNTSRNSRLPNLNAGVGQNFSFGRMASDIDNSYVNTQASSTSVSLSTSIPVFQGFRISHEIKQDQLNLQAAAEGLKKAQENLELQVAGYFLDVLFKKEILYVYTEQLAFSEKQLAQTEELVRTGKVAESQLFDMRSQAAANEVNLIGARNELDLSLLNLSQALNLPWSPGFDIAAPDMDNVVADNISSIQSPDRVYQTALDVKPHVREAEFRLRSSERQVKIAQSGRWPSLSLGASIGDSYYYMFGQDLPQQSFADQIRNKHSESVGLNLSIPIFNRLQTRNTIRQARLSTTDYSLRLESVKQELYKEIQQAYQGAVAAQAKFSATQKAMQAAEESFRAVQLRYEYGKATVYEYNELQTKLVSSTSDQLQAKYDFLFRAKILDFYRGEPIDIE